MKAHLLLSLAGAALFCTACPLQVPANDASSLAATVSLTGAGGAPLPAAVQLLVGSDATTVSVIVADAQGKPLNGAEISWDARPSGIVSLSSTSGASVTITPVAAGTATVTVSAGNASQSFQVVVQKPAGAVTITGGADTLALGGADATFTAQGTAGTDFSGAQWFSAEPDILAIVGASKGQSVTVHVAGPGIAHLGLSFQGQSPARTLTLTATALTIASTTNVLTPGGSATLTAAVTGQGGAVGNASRTNWAFGVSSAGDGGVAGQCAFTSGSTGASVVVQGQAAGSCAVAASIGALTSSQLTLTVAAVLDITITPGSKQPLVAGGATKTYTAQVIGSGGVTLAGASVVWSGGGGVFTVTTAGVVTPVGIGVADLAASAGGISRSVSITVLPAAVAFAASAAVVATTESFSLQLVGKDASGNVAPIVTAPAPGTSLTVNSTPQLTLGPIAVSDGSVFITATAGAAPQSWTVTATLFGVATSAALQLSSVHPVVSLGAIGAAQVGSQQALIPSVTLSGVAHSSLPALYSGTGDAVLLGLPLQADNSKDSQAQVQGLGIEQVTVTAGGVASAPVAVVAVPASLRLLQGATVLDGITAASVQIGSTITVTATPLDTRGVVIPLSAGTLALALGSAIASKSCTTTAQQLTCDLTGSTGGTTSLAFTYTAADGTTSMTNETALGVTAASAPTWPSGTFSAVWQGGGAYALSFPKALGSGSGLSYKLYSSDSAVTLFAGTPIALSATTNGTAVTAQATLTAPSFDSHRLLGVTALFSNSGESVGQPLTMNGAVTAGPLVFVAGRVAWQSTLDPSPVLTPLFPVADAAGEHTAPRLTGAKLGGVALSGGAQLLYQRDGATTAFAAPASPSSFTTDLASCAASPLPRPTTAFFAFAKPAGSLELDAVVTQTQSFHSCDQAVLLLRSPTATRFLADPVTQVAQAGDHSVVLLRAGQLELIDLTDSTFAERPVSQAALPAGTVIAAVPLGAEGSAGAVNATLAFTFDGTNGLRSWSLSGALPVTPTQLLAAGSLGAPVRMLAVTDPGSGKPAFVLELVSGAAHSFTLLYPDVASGTGYSSQANWIGAAQVGADQPTLGSTYDAGH